MYLGPILVNIAIHTLSFQTLEFAPYPFKPWKSHLVLTNIGIRTLFFWNIAIRILSFESLKVEPYPFAIRSLFFSTLELAPCPYEQSNSHLNLTNVAIRSLFF